MLAAHEVQPVADHAREDQRDAESDGDTGNAECSRLPDHQHQESNRIRAERVPQRQLGQPLFCGIGEGTIQSNGGQHDGDGRERSEQQQVEAVRSQPVVDPLAHRAEIDQREPRIGRVHGAPYALDGGGGRNRRVNGELQTARRVLRERNADARHLDRVDADILGVFRHPDDRGALFLHPGRPTRMNHEVAPDRIAVAEQAPGEVLIDDGDVRRTRGVGRGELASGDDPRAERREVVEADRARRPRRSLERIDRLRVGARGTCTRCRRRAAATMPARHR